MKHLRQEEAAKKHDSPYMSEMEEAVEESIEEEIDLEQMMQISEEELEKLMDELEEAMRQLEREAAQASPDQATPGQVSGPDDEERLEDVLSDGQDTLDLQQLKKKHRSGELREIMEADMRYLKALFQKLAQEKQNGSNGSSDSGNFGNNAVSGGISLELSGMDIPVPPAELPVSAEGGNMDVCV